MERGRRWASPTAAPAHPPLLPLWPKSAKAARLRPQESTRQAQRFLLMRRSGPVPPQKTKGRRGRCAFLFADGGSGTQAFPRC